MFQRKDFINEYIQRLSDNILELQEETWDLIFGFSTAEVRDQALHLHSLCYELFNEACDLEDELLTLNRDVREGVKERAKRVMATQGDIFLLKVFEV